MILIGDKTAVIGDYAIRLTGPYSVWITLIEGGRAGEGGQFLRAAMNEALFPGELRDLFAGVPDGDTQDALVHRLDAFYCENF